MIRLCIVALLLAACTATPPARTIAWQARGTLDLEGHFDRPHAERRAEVTLRYWQQGDAARCEVEETWPSATAPDRSDHLRRSDGVCAGRDDGGAFTVDADGARLLRLLEAATTATSGSLALPFQHPRLGDVSDRVDWQPAIDGGATQLQLVWHRAESTERLSLQLSSTNASADADAFATGPLAAPAAPLPARFATLAPGVHEIVLPDVDSRSLVVEFADHLVLCETSLDNDAGERLLAALDTHLPGKPVRYVLFGHYHPHYTGGLRPLLARGAIAVAPPLGAAFAREIAARPFRSPPDALAASGREPRVESFTGERRFADADNELVAIDIGADSHHTDEYVVFWLPRQQLLFEGDLGWFEGPSGLRGGGVRARGLLHAIDSRGLPVQTLLQSWPATHGPATLPMERFRALLAP